MQQLKVVCVVVLMLVPFVAEGRPPAQPIAGPVLDLATSTPDKYGYFISAIERLLISTTTGSPPPIKKRPVLGVQKRSATCFHVVIKSGNVQSTTTAVRTDNIYVVGFKTQQGTWYSFKGDAGFLPGSTSLKFAGDYKSLKDGHSKLGDVDIGKTSAQEALATLASYTSSTPENEIKEALTRLVVMLAEATRFVPIRAAVKAAWEDGGKFPQVGVDLVVVWRETSCAMLVWSRGGKWKTITEVVQEKLEEKGDPLMDTVEHGAENVHLLLRPSEPCSDGKTAADSVDYELA